MVTAAIGAEKFFSQDTNEARYEDVDEAIQKDKRIREAYMGHSKWYLIDNNCTSFKEKIDNAKQAVHSIVGK